MKKILNFIDDMSFQIFMLIIFLAIIFLIIIFEYQLSKSDIFDLEERCYVFYRDNNYVLDECDRYKDKLMKVDNK